MNIRSFAAKVKEKYPEYADVPDTVLAGKIIAKYPEYRENIDAEDLTALDNLAQLDGQGPFSELAGAAEVAGKPVKAGIAGVGDLVAGNGLDQAAADIKHVQNDEDPETTAGKVGKFVGSLVTPAQIAMQAGIGGIMEASGIGEWVTGLLKGWSENAALNAIGSIKAVAKAMGVQNLDTVGRFLLTPLKIGEKEFPAIVSATSSPSAMLEAVRTLKQAAGKALEAVSGSMDTAIGKAANAGGAAINDAPVAIDLAALRKSIVALKEAAVGDLPNLGKAVANQYENALADLDLFVKKQLEGQTATAFSELSAIKTKIGNLVFKHGSPLESKAALNDVYHAISDTLESSASKVGGKVSEAYTQANAIYHQAAAVESALEGKVVNAAKWFDAPAMLAAMSAGFATHGPMAALTVPAAYVGAKVAQNYGPQAIAQGLDAAAPAIGTVVKQAPRALPLIGRALQAALNSDGK